MRALRRSGLRVPDDVSIVGFDGHDMADLLELTTVAQPVVEQGLAIAHLLLDRLTPGPHTEDTQHVISLPTRLVVRGSTRPYSTPYTDSHSHRTRTSLSAPLDPRLDHPDPAP